MFRTNFLGQFQLHIIVCVASKQQTSKIGTFGDQENICIYRVFDNSMNNFHGQLEQTKLRRKVR